VHPGDHESVYVNMPAFGVGKVGELIEVGAIPVSGTRYAF
jgi:hypothetical protein